LFSFEGLASPPVNHPPTAGATVTCTGLTCSYNGTASADPDGDTLTYAWDFDDGSNGSGATTTHTYAPADAGPHTVTLTVTDPDGESDPITIDINPQPLANQPPTAAATITCELLACDFDASDSEDPDGTIDSYAWDFDDDVDGTGSGETTSHTFSAAGPRTVALTVTDPSRRTATTTTALVVQAGPGSTDRVAPRLSGVSLSSRRLRLGQALPKLVGGAGGTQIRFTLSEQAMVTLRFTPMGKGSSKRAPLALVVDGRAGANRLRFAGRISKRKQLRLGRHKLSVTAADAAGNRSRGSVVRQLELIP